MLVVENLRCENLRDPLCIDSRNPRLGWTLSSSDRAQTQSAYRILVASSAGRLAEEEGDLWDSGRVPSGTSFQINYRGKKMASFRRHYWKVRVWDQEGRPSDWSPPAEWSAGILHPNDWKAETIARARQPLAPGPLPLFRHEFPLDDLPERAVLYSFGLGFHEMFINGKKVGDQVLAPLWTNYRKKVFYVAHEVTNLLRPGKNAVAAELGNGFFNVPGGRYVKYTGSFGTLMLRAMIRIEHTNGSVSFVGTNSSWKTKTGPTLFSCIYGGEDHDARNEPPGWKDAGFNDSDWEDSGFDGEPGGIVRAQNAAPLKVMEIVPAKRLDRPNGKLPIYEFEKNFSGWPKISVRGERGSSVRLRIAESLDEYGDLDPSSILCGYKGESVSFAYRLKGDGIEEWHPRFSYTGFRYAEVTLEGEAEILRMEGHFVYSSSPKGGDFHSSNDLFNRIDRLVDNAVKSNFQAVLTDCPHREKLGWLEVSYLMAPSILFKYDAEALFEKIVDDTKEGQTPEGLVPDICPEYTVFRGPFRDSPEWGSAAVILPWILYRWRGNLGVLKTAYPTMVRYVDYLMNKAVDGIVRHGRNLWIIRRLFEPLGH